jgi:enamine deaminase RidA (YjgF/YER057c/UK114 family)
MDRFDRFTHDARVALTLAQEEAQRLNHHWIGTEHILLGVAGESGGPAGRVLARLDVRVDRVREAVEFILGRGDRSVVGEAGLTPRAKRVIEFAIEEARERDDRAISSAHLLLGLVRESDGIAAGVLESLGISLDRVREAVTGEIGAGGFEDEPQGPSSGPARRRISSGSPWEDRIGFSRAVRIGDRVVVSGSAPIWPDGSCDPDPERQADRCLEIIAKALEDAEAALTDVIRTRIYLTDAADADAVGRAHARAFGDVRPAATMVVVAGLLDPRWKVEMEAEAQLG